jgi:hypothetical protein
MTLRRYAVGLCRVVAGVSERVVASRSVPVHVDRRRYASPTSTGALPC